MDASHTPGPWMAASRASSVVGLPVVATPSGRSIASVTFFGLGKGFENHEQESYANSRLIAAAPEMLEALMEVERKFRVYTHEDQAVLNMVRAAIAKSS